MLNNNQYAKKQAAESFNCLIDIYKVFSSTNKGLTLNEYQENSKKRKKYNAAMLTDYLGIKICLYCNRNYIENIGKSNKIAQLDHFYHKSTYPIFALNFFNLIPVCGSCNHRKGTNNFKDSPYRMVTTEELHQVLFEFEFNDSKIFDACLSSNSIKIKCNKSSYEDLTTILKIEEMYQLHTLEVIHLLKRRLIYSNTKINELKTDFPKLFTSKELIEETLFGHKIDPTSFMYHSLSKLKYDIFQISEENFIKLV